jgi:flavin-dependent dehydrogenase
MMTTPCALVIGGGVAGGAMAAHLAEAGRHIILVERTIGPHDKVCGEFVSGEAALYLRDLDIDIESLGAVRISTARIYERHNMVSVELPFPAFSLSRRVLDEAILQKASASGAQLRRGCLAKSLNSSGGLWCATLDDGSVIAAKEAFLATGKHDLKGWKRPQTSHNDLVGFKLHFHLSAIQAAKIDSCVELFLFPGGYAGLQPVENGVANLCLVVRRDWLAQIESKWDGLLSQLRELPTLGERLAEAGAVWQRPLAVASIPYGYLNRSVRGPWRVGDQAAVIPSFSGEGISIALHSARMAAGFLSAGKTALEFQHCLASDLGRQVQMSTQLSRMLVHPYGQAIAMRIARLTPVFVEYIAQRSRIRGSSLLGRMQ